MPERSVTSSTRSCGSCRESSAASASTSASSCSAGSMTSSGSASGSTRGGYGRSRPISIPPRVQPPLAAIAAVVAGEPSGGPLAQLSPSERFGWVAAMSSTAIQPSEVHTGLTDDPQATLDHLFDVARASARLSPMAGQELASHRARDAADLIALRRFPGGTRSCSGARTRARAARPPRSSTRSTNGSRSSSGQRVQVAHQAHGLHERPRVVGRHRPRLEPAGDVGEPGALAARRRSPRRRRSSRPLPVGEVRRERLVAGNRVGQHPERVDVPAAAALGDELPAGLDRGVQAREQPVVVVDPVKRRVGEDRVDRLRQLELDEVLAEDRGAVAERLAGRARPSTGPRRPRTPGRAAPGQPAVRSPGRAAAGVEHDLVAGERPAARAARSAHRSWMSETRSYVAASQSRTCSARS